MALPKLDNTQLEKQGAEVISQNKEIIAAVQSMQTIFSQKLDTISKETTAYQQLLFLTQIERVGRHTADNMLNTTLTLNKMLPFVAQIADNVYNIAARIAGNQVTSMKETIEAIGEQQVAMYKKTLGGFKLDDLKDLKAKPEDEGAKIEAEREKEKEKKPDPRKEEKKKSPFERFMEVFDKVLAPLFVGAVLGIAKALGMFESTVGKIVTVLLAAFTALYVGMSSFRKKVNELFVSGFKKLFGKPAAPPMGAPSAPGVPPGVPGTPGAPGAPSTPAPGTPDVKGGKPGPSGLDKFLEGARKTGKAIKDLFVGIADTIKQVLGKLAEGIKQFISKVSEGIKVLLQNIAKGIESFGKTSVLKGAAALLVVSGAIFVAAKAFEVFTKVGWEDLAKAGVAILGLTAAVAGIGTIAPLIITGSIAFGAMSAALVVFAGAVNLLAKGLPALSDFLTQISTLDGTSLLSAAAGITAIGVAIAALGAGQVIGALGNFASSILSFGKDDIFTKLTKLGEVAGDLNQLPATIEALGKLSNFKVSNDFMKNVDMLSAGLKKIAESAKGFEKTGDSLTALAKIAEVMNKPAAGTTPTQPGTAPGTPTTSSKPGGTVQAKPQGQPAKVFSEAEIQKQRDAAAKMPEGSVARRNAESRIQSMESQNKVAQSFEQATPEQKQAVIEGKPVAKGQQLTTDSQKVEAAKGGGMGGGSTNVVNAPQQSVVNAPQNQVINTPLSAYGIFGGKVSNAQGAAAF